MKVACRFAGHSDGWTTGSAGARSDVTPAGLPLTRLGPAPTYPTAESRISWAYWASTAAASWKEDLEEKSHWVGVGGGLST